MSRSFMALRLLVKIRNYADDIYFGIRGITIHPHEISTLSRSYDENGIQLYVSELWY